MTVMHLNPSVFLSLTATVFLDVFFFVLSLRCTADFILQLTLHL